MNNNNNPAVLKALIAYALCIPLAVAVGWLLASESLVSQPGRVNWAWDVLIVFNTHPFVWGSLVLLLCSPLLLRWHHLLLVGSLNLGMSMFFLPGTPGLWMPVMALSLGISVLYRALNSKAHFISAPQITWPLIFLAAVVLFTAKLRGGIGLHSMGSEEMGGKRYIFILGGILGYFALTAQRIPPERAGLYVLFFFLGGFFSVIGDLANVMPSSLYFIFALFPANGYTLAADARYGGAASMAQFCFWLMLARYGIRGIFLSGKWWRPIVLFLSFAAVFLGGFRSFVVLCVMVFCLQFFLERMHYTKLLPAFVFAGIIIATLCVPFTDKLPYAVQRSLAFLPVHIDPMARQDASASLNWRLEVWQAVLPQVPDYLLLGKGYGISQSDYQDMTTDFNSNVSAEDWGSTIAGDYHNGPLSVILPLGIWGVIGFLWFLIASGRALHNNYRYGDPALRTVNTFLFAFFVVKVVFFFLIFGSLYSDLVIYTGIIGLSISLNGGIRRLAAAPVQPEAETNIPALMRPRFQPF